MRSAIALLVTDDESLSRTTEDAGKAIASLTLMTARSPVEAMPAFEHPDLALVLAHVRTPADAEGAAGLLRSAAAAERPVPTVVIGEPGAAEMGLNLLRRGAADYLERPLDLRRLPYLLDALTLRTRRRGGASANSPAFPESDFIFDPGAVMGRVMAQIRTVAPVDTMVLLLGETGTGKTHLAQILHDLSPRRDKPFAVINCAALSATLIDSELFGHTRGAFTGAERDRAGKIAEAGCGTLLLDEIDSLPLELQAKLLRVVEARTFEAVGSDKPQPVRARLIAASNRDLRAEAAAGRFRSDLFYRLNVVSFRLPPLRERSALIPTMIRKFVEEFATRFGRPVYGVSPAALRQMLAYPWPGNVRELRNAVERAVALRPGGLIEPDDLPDAVRATAVPPGPEVEGLVAGRTPPPDATLASAREVAEAERIAEALRRNNGNRQRTAAELGISRVTLYKKLYRYGLAECPE